MIKRINLVEKHVFTLTYLRLVQVGVALLLIVSVFIGYQVYNATRLDKKLLTTQSEIKKLETIRDSLMKKKVKRKVSVGEYQELLNRIENVPNWTKIISDVTEKLPNTVWLTNFKSVGGATGFTTVDTGANDKDKKNKDAEKKAKVVKASYKLEISGLSSSMRNVTEFSSKLDQTKYLNNIKVESQKNNFGFSFVIIGDVNTNAR
ncbi:MAG: PilN domain-containing protein [bacterium]|nr:PilN domain-containing protein [bacterium]MBU1919026.1 PilN domain-containing protein [bacterium]